MGFLYGLGGRPATRRYSKLITTLFTTRNRNVGPEILGRNVVPDERHRRCRRSGYTGGTAAGSRKRGAARADTALPGRGGFGWRPGVPVGNQAQRRFKFRPPNGDVNAHARSREIQGGVDTGFTSDLGGDPGGGQAFLQRLGLGKRIKRSHGDGFHGPNLPPLRPNATGKKCFSTQRFVGLLDPV